MKKNLSAVQLDLGTAPLIEMSGNRRVNVEGSSGSCVEIEGFITKIEFIS